MYMLADTVSLDMDDAPTYGAIGLNNTPKPEEAAPTVEDRETPNAPATQDAQGKSEAPKTSEPKPTKTPPADSGKPEKATTKSLATSVKPKAPKKSSGKPPPKVKGVSLPCDIPGVQYTLDFVRKLDSATSHLACVFRFEYSSNVWVLYNPSTNIAKQSPSFFTSSDRTDSMYEKCFSNLPLSKLPQEIYAQREIYQQDNLTLPI